MVSPVSGSILRDALDLVAPELEPHRLLLVGRIDLHRVAAHAKRAAVERDIVAHVLDADERAQDVVARDLLPLASDTMRSRYDTGSPRP